MRWLTTRPSRAGPSRRCGPDLPTGRGCGSASCRNRSPGRARCVHGGYRLAGTLGPGTAEKRGLPRQRRHTPVTAAWCAAHTHTHQAHRYVQFGLRRQRAGIAQCANIIDETRTGGRAARITAGREVSTEIGIDVERARASTTGTTRAISAATDGGRAPGRVDAPPMSSMSAPCAMSASPWSIAAAESTYRPPSENKSGVALTIPRTRLRHATQQAIASAHRRSLRVRRRNRARGRCAC